MYQTSFITDMVIVGLGTVTIVAMFLWVIVSIVSKFTALPGCKAGLVVSYLVAVAWTAGILL